jgi:hypothetical protein
MIMPKKQLLNKTTGRRFSASSKAILSYDTQDADTAVEYKEQKDNDEVDQGGEAIEARKKRKELLRIDQVRYHYIILYLTFPGHAPCIFLYAFYNLYFSIIYCRWI